MATVKAVYHTGSVYIRITINRKHRYVHLFGLDKDKFEKGKVKGTNKETSAQNLIISNKLHAYQSRLYYLTINDIEPNFENIEGKITYRTVLDAIQTQIDKKNELEQFGSERKYQNLYEKVKDFGDSKIKDLTLRYMEMFQKYLLDHKNINSKETVNRYVKFLKTCIRYETGLNQRVLSFTPVSGYIPKVKLTREEVEAIKKLDNKKYELIRDVFVTLIDTWGCRIGDMLQMQYKHLKGDQLIYIEQKTGKNKTVNLNQDTLDVFKKYEGQSEYYLFPMLTMKPDNPKSNKEFSKHIEAKTVPVNTGLKMIAALCGINKSISTHVARHTFAKWSIDRGLSLHKIMQLLNHSSLSTTEAYIKELKRDDDLGAAAALVLG